MDFLKKCVVVRFVGEGEVCWPEFRIWAHRQWGVSSHAEVLPIGDDLWLLECASEDEVNRIISLRRFRFKEFDLLLDGWIKQAGRSGVTWESNSAWVVVRGVPLHLRSLDLAKSLGDVLGGFLAMADSTDLSSFRLKVKRVGDFPLSISCSVGEEVYSVGVMPEEGLPSVLQRAGSERKRSLKGKSMAAMPDVAEDQGMEELCWAETEWCGGECSGGRGTFPEVEAVGEVLASSGDLIGTEQQQLSGGRAFGGGCRQKIVESRIVAINPFLQESVPMMDSLVGYRLIVEGIKVGKMCIDFGQGVGLSLGWVDVGRWRGYERLIGLGLQGIGPGELGAFSCNVVEVERGSLVFPFFKERALLAGPDLLEEEDQSLSSSLGPCVEVAALQELPFHLEGVLQPGAAVTETEDLISEAIRSVASIIQLEVNGSLEDGVTEAVELGKEVIRRRTPSILKSRTERELKRLGPSPEVAATRRRTSKGKRCVSPVSFDEF
ncbi:hypothetical protein LINPERHAP1_LOCUS23092 [Linum perenne]